MEQRPSRQKRTLGNHFCRTTCGNPRSSARRFSEPSPMNRQASFKHIFCSNDIICCVTVCFKTCSFSRLFARKFAVAVNVPRKFPHQPRPPGAL